MSRNAFKGGYWRELRDMTRRLNEGLQEQQRLRLISSRKQHSAQNRIHLRTTMH